MAELKHPHLGSVIQVPKDLVGRYTEAGYVEVKSEDKSAPQKRTSRKSK